MSNTNKKEKSDKIHKIGDSRREKREVSKKLKHNIETFYDDYDDEDFDLDYDVDDEEE